MHNETSTGVTSRIADVRDAIDRARHPALFMVDTISSLASIDYRHDEWGVDVTVAGSQKGLMLPPGLSFNAISDKALAAAKTAKLPRSYWDWSEMLAINPTGFFPYTPATNLLYGLAEALDMLFDEGLDSVFARHDRLAEATRRAVRAWGLEILCADPAQYSSTLTAVLMPEGHNADAFRKVILDRFDMSLGQGLGKVAGQGLPHRPPRRLQRPDALRHARRRRDGPGARRRSRTGRAASQAAMDYLADATRGVRARARRAEPAALRRTIPLAQAAAPPSPARTTSTTSGDRP